MDNQINILILEDNPSDAELVQRELRKAGLDFTAQLAQNKEAFLDALDKFIPDLILADYSLPGFSGMGAMTLARERFADIPVIVVSGAIGEEVAIETIKAGATDYVLKQRLSRLGSVVHRALEEARLISEKKQAQEALRQNEERLRTQTKDLETIIGIVSHDLRAPLLNVRGFNKFIKNDCANVPKLLAQVDIPHDVQKKLDQIFNKDIPESAGFIDTSAEAMTNLVELLVKVARTGLVVPKPEILDMNKIAKDIVDNIKIKLKNSGATINIEYLPPCFADSMHIIQIFTNLIDNAVKYIDHNRPGEICIAGSTEKPGKSFRYLLPYHRKNCRGRRRHRTFNGPANGRTQQWPYLACLRERQGQ